MIFFFDKIGMLMGGCVCIVVIECGVSVGRGDVLCFVVLLV